jgi:hypothetical protein
MENEFKLTDPQRAAVIEKGQKIADLLADRSIKRPGYERQLLTGPVNDLDETPDLIVVFGVGNTIVAETAAHDFVKARKINPNVRVVFTGGIGRATPNIWKENEKPEAVALKAAFLAQLKKIAPELLKGIEPFLLVEDQSNDSGENILFTSSRLRSEGFADSIGRKSSFGP